LPPIEQQQYRQAVIFEKSRFTRAEACAILNLPMGRQFETILSINKTRDENKIAGNFVGRALDGCVLLSFREEGT